MKFSASVFLVLIIGFSNLSCEKRQAIPGDRPIPVVTPPSYSQLKTGNYWIYAYYQVDAIGNGVLTDRIDSCYVEKDTLIHGATFFKLHRHELSQNTQLNYYMRDSLSYIIDYMGKILFAADDFSTVFYPSYVLATPSTDTLYKISSKMTDKNLVVQIPAGTFTTSNMQTTYTTTPRFNNPRANYINYTNTRYAQGKGLITQTEPLIFEAKYVVERRLVRYAVK